MVSVCCVPFLHIFFSVRFKILWTIQHIVFYSLITKIRYNSTYIPDDLAPVQQICEKSRDTRTIRNHIALQEEKWLLQALETVVRIRDGTIFLQLTSFKNRYLTIQILHAIEYSLFSKTFFIREQNRRSKYVVCRILWIISGFI